MAPTRHTAFDGSGIFVLNGSKFQPFGDNARLPSGHIEDLVAVGRDIWVGSTEKLCRIRDRVVGDPTDGGQLITGTDGRTDVVVSNLLPAQEKVLVELPWQIPAGLTRTSIKIYAVIDAINQIDEIHEDNNVGWNEVFLRTTP